jgi:hypothetical protein
MIIFDYHTYKAEINAMPCLPDEFEIYVSKQTVLMKRSTLELPVFRGYDCTEYQGINSIVLRYKTYLEPWKPPISVQDLILRRFKKA